ncbi:VOC family protein [Conexibacter woesei]|uniref:Glyoxalase/bleomycin resistance protein/dioxygenase n=1 Tax=Conexibacter woesei (strain DSM 14684 / CCUG 47730 / CIP 108061 / JCM 11494 / NBRC 100937 / ID131577) TaxID=469383 RepID=D3F3P6_CONWI|nr:VOC family protein [Conexibacter woesei]ADB52411.1 glyoxalase/bleomycin resistance protein/dioxygenase [Conexibacter woesei DSM 14684]
MAGEVSFIELGVEDTERGRRFYERLFGWSFGPSPSGPGFVFDTPTVPGGMHGGDPGGGAYVFFRVEDIDAAIARVQELGGTLEQVDAEGNDESIARFGRFQLCRDDQGSAFGLHQPPPGR